MSDIERASRAEGIAKEALRRSRMTEAEKAREDELAEKTWELQHPPESKLQEYGRNLCNIFPEPGKLGDKPVPLTRVGCQPFMDLILDQLLHGNICNLDLYTKRLISFGGALSHLETMAFEINNVDFIKAKDKLVNELAREVLLRAKNECKCQED